jgi:hypothetical protein
LQEKDVHQTLKEICVRMVRLSNNIRRIEY